MIMKKIETKLKDCYIIEPSLFGDDRFNVIIPVDVSISDK